MMHMRQVVTKDYQIDWPLHLLGYGGGGVRWNEMTAHAPVINSKTR